MTNDSFLYRVTHPPISTSGKERDQCLQSCITFLDQFNADPTYVYTNDRSCTHHYPTLVWRLPPCTYLI